MGVDYIVRLIKQQNNLPEIVQKFIKPLDKEEATINGEKYWLTMDWNGESNGAGSSEDYEAFSEWFDKEIEAGRAAYGNFG